MGKLTKNQKLAAEKIEAGKAYVLVFCSTSKPLISSYLGINAVYRNSFDSLPSELIVIAHDNDRLSGNRENLWGGGQQ